tara:strand:+ start:341 stop:715 length:375 start_codon:yes stop_codon:yes gene_type:complete
MKYLTGSLAVLALALVILTGSNTQAHDTGNLHFHGEQLSMDAGALCYRSCLRKLGNGATERCARECADSVTAPGNQGAGQPSNQNAAPSPKECQTMLLQCSRECGADRGCIQRCRKTRPGCTSN